MLITFQFWCLFWKINVYSLKVLAGFHVYSSQLFQITGGHCGWEVKSTWLRTKIKGCRFNPQQPIPAIFQPRIAKKINKALSIRVRVICCVHRLLLQDSYRCVGCASTLPEPMLHKIFIIITSWGYPTLPGWNSNIFCL